MGSLSSGEISPEGGAARVNLEGGFCWHEPDRGYLGYAGLGLPTVILESLAVGRPVVASDLGPRAESVVPGGTGLLFEPWSADDLGRKVAEIAADRARLVAMGRAARDLYVARYKPEPHYAALLGIYTRALERDAQTAKHRERPPQGK